MAKRRVSETDQGMTGDLETRAYDQIMRRMRDKGWAARSNILGLVVFGQKPPGQ